MKRIRFFLLFIGYKIYFYQLGGEFGIRRKERIIHNAHILFTDDRDSLIYRTLRNYVRGIYNDFSYRLRSSYWMVPINEHEIRIQLLDIFYRLKFDKYIMRLWLSDYIVAEVDEVPDETLELIKKLVQELEAISPEKRLYLKLGSPTGNPKKRIRRR